MFEVLGHLSHLGSQGSKVEDLFNFTTAFYLISLKSYLANKILNRCVLIFSQIAHFNLSIFNIYNYHYYVHMSFCDI